MGGTRHAVGAQSMVPVTHYSGHAYREPLFQGQGSQELDSWTPKWFLEPSFAPPWSLTLDFSSSSKITFLGRGGGREKMASSGSLGSDFTIPRWVVGRLSTGPRPWAGDPTRQVQNGTPWLWTLASRGLLLTCHIELHGGEFKHPYFEATPWGSFSEAKPDPNPPSFRPS